MKVVLEHLTKEYPKRGKKEKGNNVVLDNISIEIPDGKLIGLLGPSGCGKSTTLNLISGLEQPTKGRIFFGDDDVTELEPRHRGIGLVFQNYALYPHLTTLDNILFPLQNLKGEEKISKKEMLEKAEDAAKLVQIEKYLDRKPNELSGGQQQRVAIARALVKMPKVLLLDEPLSNLDARLRIQTREEIRRIQKKTGVTTIFVTHDQEEAMSICDQIVVMKKGTIQQVGKPQEIYDNPENLFVAKFLGTPPINVFDAKISGGKLIIGDDEVMETGITEDRPVYAAIRPEGFITDKNGAMTCRLRAIEVMGRDTSIISENDACLSESIRSVISAETIVDENAETVRFNLKPNKVFIFDKETEERIYTEA